MTVENFKKMDEKYYTHSRSSKNPKKDMKSPTPSKAVENQRKREKSGIITNVSNIQKAKKERKRNIKQVGQLKANGTH